MKSFTFECGPVAEDREDLTITGVDEVGGCVVAGMAPEECEAPDEVECGGECECGCCCC